MKQQLLIQFCLLAFFSTAFSNGVAVIDAHNAVYLRMISSQVEVSVENQVALTKTTQLFRNDSAVGDLQVICATSKKMAQ
jgi:hypothetical protein